MMALDYIDSFTTTGIFPRLANDLPPCKPGPVAELLLSNQIGYQGFSELRDLAS